MVGGGPGSRLSRPGRRRRRRRFSPVVVVVMVAAAGFGIGVLWKTVFAPLFVDADAWIEDERAFRRVIHRVLKGRHDGLPDAPDLPEWPAPLTDAQVRLLTCADAQVARDVRYTVGYHTMSYPWGDVPEHLATAPDIIIRCFRATGLDLQQLIHIDRTANPRRYPLRIWANRAPDKSIDHRRLPNMYTFIKTYTTSLPVLTDSIEKVSAFQPGDIVFWVAPGGGEWPGHAGIVTDRRGPDGVPLVVTILKDERRISDHHKLNDWQVSGHFRVDPDELLDKFLQDHPEARLQPRM